MNPTLLLQLHRIFLPLSSYTLQHSPLVKDLYPPSSPSSHLHMLPPPPPTPPCVTWGREGSQSSAYGNPRPLKATRPMTPSPTPVPIEHARRPDRAPGSRCDALWTRSVTHPPIRPSTSRSVLCCTVASRTVLPLQWMNPPRAALGISPYVRTYVCMYDTAIRPRRIRQRGGWESGGCGGGRGRVSGAREWGCVR